jgi:hypothetical protein
MNRQDIVDAYAAYAMIHRDGPIAVERISGKPELRDLCMVSLWGHRSPHEYLRSLEDSALQAYFGLVDKLQGREAANAALLLYARVGWPDGLTVHVTNSDDDPFRVNFHAYSEIASDWADAQGALDGGTWEGEDEFIHDSGMWDSKLFDRLRAEGYRLDLSEWSDPEPEDHETAKHISECYACQDHWDFSKAREHMQDVLVATAELKLQEAT